MRNPMLETCILKILNRIETGLKEKTLVAEVEVAMGRYDLTTDEVADVIKYLEDKALVDQFTTSLGDKVWGITDLGKDALKGL